MIRSAMGAALVVLALALAAAAGAAAPALAQETEHLPKRAKPPAAGVRPRGLPPYAEIVGVRPASDADRSFDALADSFLLVYFRAQPVRASRVRLHDYDALFPPTDSAAVDSMAKEFEVYRARLAAIDAERLGAERRSDRDVLAARLDDDLFDARTARAGRLDPRWCVAIVSEGLHALVDSAYAPLEDRTWNVIARLTDLHRVFRDSRASVRAPARRATDEAREQAATLARFLADELPQRVAPLRDPVLGEEFDHHLASAVSAVSEYRYWLKSGAPVAPDAPADPPQRTAPGPHDSKLAQLLRR